MKILCMRVGCRGVIVQGNKLTFDEQQVTEDSATYRAEWVTTGFIKCKKGERQTINAQLQVTSGAETLNAVSFVADRTAR